MDLKIRKRAPLLLILAAMLIGGSCVKNSTTTPPISNPTIAQVIKSATNLTIWNAALIRANLDTVLNDTTFRGTVFVCTDQVMGNYGLGANVIDTMGIGRLDTILLYNIIAGEALLSTALVPGGTGQNVSTQIASGDSVFITYEGGALFVNGISAPTTDVRAGEDGYLDVMAQPLIPPSGTIMQILQADTTLSYFDSLIALTSGASNNLQALLTSGIYTVFVPNNTAIRNLSPNAYDSLKILQVDSLANLLAFHFVTGRYFTSDMLIALSNPSNNSGVITQPTLSDSALKVSEGVAFQVQGAGDSGVAANIFAPNILARNGVVHKVDKVLVP